MYPAPGVSWQDDLVKRGSGRLSRNGSLAILPGIVEVVDDSPSSPSTPKHHFSKSNFAQVGFAQVLGSPILGSDMAIDFGSDERDMERMGRKVELKRTFNLHSCIGFSIILNSSWPFSLVTGTYTLSNGGLAGNFWLFVIVCAGMFTVMLSMAEMASITPSAGAQYHWTSEYAPHRCHKFLSFCVGWFTTIGWISAMVLVCYVGAQQVQSLIALYSPDYVAHAWHSSLLTIAVNLFAVAVNIFLVRKLALIEGLILILYIAGFFFVLVVLWVMGERRTATAVFTEFENTSGYSSVILACLTNISNPVVTLIGSDSPCHMAEEMRNARWGVPRAVIANALFNYVIGSVMWMTFLFNVGNIEAVQNSPYGQSYVAVLLYATNSRAATGFCVGLILFLMLMCAVNQTTTASRQVYAFARDNGMPFSKWLCSVRQGWDFPLNALLAALICSFVITMATMRSTNAFTVMNACSIGGLTWSYGIAIGVVFWRKIIMSDRFPVGKFIMGRKTGLMVNFLAVCFLLIVVVFTPFPLVADTDAHDWNWSSLALVSCVISFLVYYWLYAKKHYTSPVERTRKHD